MLDNDGRISQVGETVQYLKQFLHVVEVEAGCRLVEEIKGLSRLALTQFASQFDALRLATGEGYGRLSEVDVAESYVHQGLQFLLYQRDVFQNG